MTPAEVLAKAAIPTVWGTISQNSRDAMIERVRVALAGLCERIEDDCQQDTESSNQDFESGYMAGRSDALHELQQPFEDEPMSEQGETDEQVDVIEEMLREAFSVRLTTFGRESFGWDANGPSVKQQMVASARDVAISRGLIPQPARVMKGLTWADVWELRNGSDFKFYRKDEGLAAWPISEASLQRQAGYYAGRTFQVSTDESFSGEVVTK